MPFLVLVANVSTVVAIVLNMGWPSAFLIVPVWMLYGFACAELAIRSSMKSRGFDRSLAKFSINSDMGRRSLFRHDRFPFP